MYKINNIKELNQYFKENNITNSDDLSNKGLKYWKKELEPIVNPNLFKKPNNKEELIQLINNNTPLILIDTSNITNFKVLFQNEYNNN